MAPKINGETNAASAEVAKAYGAIPTRLCALNTRLKGTIQIPVALDWIRNNTVNSLYSVQRMVLTRKTPLPTNPSIGVPPVANQPTGRTVLRAISRFRLRAGSVETGG